MSSNFHRRHFFTSLFLATFVLLPSTLFILSFNSLPDSPLYSTKTTFESLAGLPLSVSRELSVRYQLLLLRRRLVEAQTSIPQGSITPLNLITTQADQIHQLINQNTDKPNSTLVSLFLQNLKTAISQLDDLRTNINQQNPLPTPSTSSPSQPSSPNSSFSLPNATRSRTSTVNTNDSRYINQQIQKTQYHLNYLLSQYQQD